MTDPETEREAIALFDTLLDVAEGDRAAWLDEHTAGNPALRTRLEAMLAADARAELRTGGATDTLEEEAAPVRIGAYRITGLIGRGGMGSVYRAERERGDFGHVAAIKLIKPGLLTERLVERFRGEREILARLSHPHIAQLFDGGETEGGSPFIVMEWIDGTSLADWLEAEQPGLDARLTLFAQVLDAVAFAHSHLVVHRDITPSNILVAGGRAKLIDFGISRPVEALREDSELLPSHSQPSGPTSGNTRPSLKSLSLTPGYAAPERLTGAEVNTAVDVYSLGKVLDRLLRDVPHSAELDAIAARAAAPIAADRYATVDAMADDLAAFQADLPVAAMPDHARYRFAKFFARNRVAVSAAGVVAALMIFTTAAVTWSYIRAEQARAEAEHRFEQTRAIAKLMLFDAYDEVSRVPGAVKAKEMLAKSGLEYLDALAADRDAPLDVRLEVGRGYTRLADVMGGGQAETLGRFDDANQLLEEARKVLEPLHKAHPADRDVSLAYADYLVNRAAIELFNNNDAKKGRAVAAEAEALLRPFAATAAEPARLYATALQAVADADGWDGDFAKAAPGYAGARAFIDGLPPALRDDPEMMTVHAAVLRFHGEALHKTKQAVPARAALERSLALREKLFTLKPGDPLATRNLAIILWYTAVVHRSNMRDAEARAAIDRAMALVEGLRARSPGDSGAIEMFTLVAEVKAQTLADQRAYAESYALTDRIIEAQRERVKLAGNAPGVLRQMAQTLRTGGGNHYNGGDYAGACRFWAETDAIFRGLEAKGQLTEWDRKGSVPEIRDYLTRGCNPPRAIAGLSEV